MSTERKSQSSQHWSNQPEGRALLDAESVAINRFIDLFRPKKTLFIGSFSEKIIDKRGFFHVMEAERHDANMEPWLKNRSVILADLHQLPFVSESFDLVVCAHAHENSLQEVSWLKEVFRLLVSEGVLLCMGFSKARYLALSDVFSEKGALHYQGLWAHDGWVKACEKYGFTLEDIDGVVSSMPNIKNQDEKKSFSIGRLIDQGIGYGLSVALVYRWLFIKHMEGWTLVNENMKMRAGV